MSKTYFLRTEPRTTVSDLSQGIAARIYDPLWTLGRQWQLGELLGEDAGTPVNAALQAETAMLSVYRRGRNGDDESYDPAALPLEVRVEADEVRANDRWPLRLRIDIGRELLRALDDAGMSAYASAFTEAHGFDPATPEMRAADAAAMRLLDIALGRIPDGRKLHDAFSRALEREDPLLEPPVIAANDADAVRNAALAWYAWCKETLFESGHASAWREATLDYEFSVATSPKDHALRLDAAEYLGGSLDWHSFDIRGEPKPEGFTPLPAINGLPTGVRYRGMPNARWWELEDASVDFGSIDAAASDNARLAMLEFGLVYANDFFAIPLQLPVGSLCRVSSLVVTDTFGMGLKIDAAAHGTGRQGHSRWSMFTLSEREPSQLGATGVSNVFFLPPAAQQLIADRPVEEVLLLRDEMANLAWAVERRYEGDRGVAEERAEVAMRGKPATPPPPEATAALRYLLGTGVPEYWFPLVPVQTSGEPTLQIQRMVDQPATVEPRGRFLDLNAQAIPDFAVPREGRKLLRDYVYTRWSNGAGFVWSRRRSRVGRGEGSSGLRYDVAESRPESGG
jgi:hypothetical protein